MAFAKSYGGLLNFAWAAFEDDTSRFEDPSESNPIFRARIPFTEMAKNTEYFGEGFGYYGECQTAAGTVASAVRQGQMSTADAAKELQSRVEAQYAQFQQDVDGGRLIASMRDPATPVGVPIAAISAGVTRVSSPRSLRSHRLRRGQSAVPVRRRSVLIPTLIWYAVFVLLPVIQTVQISTLDYQLLDPSRSRFIGLENFERLFANPLFPVAVVNTFVWTFLALVVIVPISLLLAQCLVIVRSRAERLPGVHLPAGRGVAGRDRADVPDPDGPRGGLLQQGPDERRPAAPHSGCRHPNARCRRCWASHRGRRSGSIVVILTAGMLNIPDRDL